MSQPGKPACLRGHPEFVVKPDCIDAFLALAQDDASHSLADEPGCRQFDVVQMEGAPHHVLFYEVYDSRAAFDAHLQTPHGPVREGFPALAEERVRPLRKPSSWVTIPQPPARDRPLDCCRGFLGTGIMGAHMARHRPGGAQSNSLEPDGCKAEALSAFGVAQACDAAAAARGADAVICMLLRPGLR